MTFTSIIGSLAAIVITAGYLPQTIRTVRTRSTDDIAMGSFLLLLLGSVLWVVYGFLIEDVPLVVANGLASIMSGTVFVIKMNNDIKKRKLKREK